MKLRNLKFYFIKSNIFTFSDFKLYLFSTVLFATLKQALKKIAVPVWYRPTPNTTGTGPKPAQIPPEFRSGPSRDDKFLNFGLPLLLYNSNASYQVLLSAFPNNRTIAPTYRCQNPIN